MILRPNESHEKLMSAANLTKSEIINLESLLIKMTFITTLEPKFTIVDSI